MRRAVRGGEVVGFTFTEKGVSEDFKARRAGEMILGGSSLGAGGVKSSVC